MSLKINNTLKNDYIIFVARHITTHKKTTAPNFVNASLINNNSKNKYQTYRHTQ